MISETERERGGKITRYGKGTSGKIKTKDMDEIKKERLRDSEKV